MANNNGSDKLSQWRWLLAIIIISISILGIVLVGGVTILFSSNRPETAQTVFTAVIPLLASWVGTVIAYYFSSESLQAATQSVKDLMPVGEKLKAIPATRVMIKRADMATFKENNAQKVQEILKTLKESGKGDRLPFLDEKDQPVYMLHKSAIDSALVEAGSKESIDMANLTLPVLFEKVPELKVLATKSFGVCGLDATLETVREEMNRNYKCQDIFITENGTKTSRVIGWITNGIIEENAKL